MNRRDNPDPYLCCGHLAGHDGPCEPSCTREAATTFEQVYAALWDQRDLLDAGIRGFSRRSYRDAARRILARLTDSA